MSGAGSSCSTWVTFTNLRGKLKLKEMKVSESQQIQGSAHQGPGNYLTQTSYCTRLVVVGWHVISTTKQEAASLTVDLCFCIKIRAEPQWGSTWGLGIRQQKLPAVQCTNCARHVHKVCSIYWVYESHLIWPHGNSLSCRPELTNTRTKILRESDFTCTTKLFLLFDSLLMLTVNDSLSKSCSSTKISY